MTAQRCLILIRHAKSGWDDPYADDHARVLTQRGQKAAHKIGTWLGQQGYVPDLILSSDAMRTRETAARIAQALPDLPKITYLPALYHAAPDTIADAALKADAQTIAIIGHNPGIGMLAHMLVHARPAHHRFSDYPTCATTVIDYAHDAWLRAGAGQCAAFVVPRDLP